MKEALIYSKNTFENILNNWYLTNKQREEIQVNIDLINESLRNTK